MPYKNPEHARENWLKYYQKNKEQILKKLKIRRQKNPIPREQKAREQMKSKYNITPKDWERMYEEQDGICANRFCDFTNHNRWWEQGNGGFYVDHDHETGYVRGLLCPKCNHLEGVVFKDVKLSYGIIEYKRIHELNERKI
jgi:hypothetical protein